MDGDLDLREAFDQGFGPEPAHPPVSERVEAGHRAVRRRRLAGTILTVSVATVMGLGAVAVLDDGPSVPSQVADEPTASPTADAWEGEEPAHYSEEGVLEIRPGATVVQRVDDPLGDPTADHRSVALAVDFEGTTTWLLLAWMLPADDVPDLTVISASPTGIPFEDWVATTVEPQDGYLSFAPDGSLVASQGVTILDQRHPVELRDFVFDGEPTAAALLQGLDGKKWYVVVRDIDGVEIIAVPYRMGGENLDAFLDYARSMYAGGAGLR